MAAILRGVYRWEKTFENRSNFNSIESQGEG